MASKKMTLKKISQLEVIKSTRKDWGTLNPVQSFKGSKKVYNRKLKHSKGW